MQGFWKGNSDESSVFEKHSSNEHLLILKTRTITKKQILDLIDKKVPNTFVNHILTALRLSNSTKGEVNGNKIFLWQHNNWLGIIHPVFCFNFSPSQKLIKITTGLNPVAKTLLYILTSIFLIEVITSYSEETINTSTLLRLGLIALLTLSFYLIFRIIYRQETRFQLETLIQNLEDPNGVKIKS